MKKIKLTLFVTVLTAALFGGGCASVKVTEEQLQEGLIGHYPFNGNAKDESGNKNHATTNAPALSLDRNGTANQAYQFDGKKSYIEIPRSRTMNFDADDFAVAVWLKFGTQSNPRRTGSILQDWKGESDFGAQIFIIDQPKGVRPLYPNKVNARTVKFRLTGREPLLLPDSPHLFDSSWRHYVFNKSGKTISIHINGERAASREVKGLQTYRGGRTDIVLGCHQNKGGQYYRGSMDEFRIYNRALSNEEVKALYDLEKPKGK